MDTTKNSEKNSKRTKIKQRLVRLATARQARVEAQTIRFYASALSGFPDEVIAQACDEFEQEVPEPFAPRFPALEALMSTCRKINGESSGPRYYCSDCANEYGLLYFDAAGNRLRGREIVIAEKRYCEPCPCRGMETDWKTLYRDRAAHPENYSTLADVIRDVEKRTGVNLTAFEEKAR